MSFGAEDPPERRAERPARGILPGVVDPEVGAQPGLQPVLAGEAVEREEVGVVELGELAVLVRHVVVADGLRLDHLRDRLDHVLGARRWSSTSGQRSSPETSGIARACGARPECRRSPRPGRRRRRARAVEAASTPCGSVQPLCQSTPPPPRTMLPPTSRRMPSELASSPIRPPMPGRVEQPAVGELREDEGDGVGRLVLVQALEGDRSTSEKYSLPSVRWMPAMLVSRSASE